MDIFEHVIIANGYSLVNTIGGNTRNYEKNNFKIYYTTDWDYAFYLSGDIDIPTPYASITTEQIVAEFEQHTPLLTQKMIDDKDIDIDENNIYYLGRESYDEYDFYDYYFFIKTEIVDNKLQFELGFYEDFDWY